MRRDGRHSIATLAGLGRGDGLWSRDPALEDERGCRHSQMSLKPARSSQPDAGLEDAANQPARALSVQAVAIGPHTALRTDQKDPVIGVSSQSSQCIAATAGYRRRQAAATLRPRRSHRSEAPKTKRTLRG